MTWVISHRIHGWNIYLHLADAYGCHVYVNIQSFHGSEGFAISNSLMLHMVAAPI